MSIWIVLLNAVAVSIFGSVLAAGFCNTLQTKRNRVVFGCSIVAILLLQGCLYSLWDVEALRKYYPLIVHLPLLLLLWVQTGKLLWPLISVLTAYLCCQCRRWLALLVVALFPNGVLTQDVVELILTLPLLVLLLRYVAPAMWPLMKSSIKQQLHFGAIPVLYYLFDYLTVVYTDLLFSGMPVVVEFMPSVCCVANLSFLLYHASVEQKQRQLQQEQDSLDIQLKQSVKEINALRESQELTRRYRHDLRHHLQFVSACIENGQGEQAQGYIRGICQEIESQKIHRYCENEAANLILSAFCGRAEKEGIGMHIQGVLPAAIKLPDSDLCVLLSNALENALHACRALSAEGRACTVDVQFYARGDKLFLQVTNPCAEKIEFENRIPVSRRPDHGIGVQSICAIVRRYGGIYRFLLQDGMFILRLSL